MKKFRTILTAFILILGSVLPVWTVEAAPKPELSIVDKTITEGGNFTLEVENEIDGSTCQWTSSNEKVAAVSNEGVVKGIKEGTATITCTLTVESTKKTYSLKCRVRVLGIPEKMTGIQVKNEKDAEALTKIIKEQLAGGAVVPTDLNDERYTWNENGRLVGIDWREAGLTGLDVSGCTALTHLDLGANQISDLSGLKKLENLTCLALDSNGISDISELGNLTNLQSLYVNNNRIRDITVFRKMENLQELDLSGNEISDFMVLKETINLKKLNLSDTMISDITVLRRLTKLTELELITSQVSDVTALQELTDLKILFLDKNRISDGQVAELQRKLPDCSIW